MSTLPWLNSEELYFPSTDTALDEPNGLLAAGADLHPSRLLYAYERGIFPWYGPEEPILWWSPSPRAVLIPKQVHISRSLNKRIARNEFVVRCDSAFSEVIKACATSPRKGQPGTWITAEMIAAYTVLHQQGHAHSIEAWQDNVLVGGLYGISIGKLFFGESMFSAVTDASKVAFISLAQNLNRWGYPLIDCQVSNPHLTSLGAINIPRKNFKQYLADYIGQAAISNWQQRWQGPQRG